MKLGYFNITVDLVAGDFAIAGAETFQKFAKGDVYESSTRSPQQIVLEQTLEKLLRSVRGKWDPIDVNVNKKGTIIAD
jgi:hypothetical protein